MVVVAQLVRAPDCDSGGRGFEPHHPPLKASESEAFFMSLLNKCLLAIPMNASLS